jgi:hypothetical protein
MTARRVFAAPLALGIVSTVGLIAALVGDGPWDALSWLTLGLPIALILLLLLRAARR